MLHVPNTPNPWASNCEAAGAVFGHEFHVEGVAFAAVSAGVDHTCGIRRSDGEVVCWGDNSEGQVSGAPSGVAFASISTGTVHTCGIRRDDGEAVCWGQEDAAQVSDAPAGVPFAVIAASYHLSCGIRDVDSELVC